MTIFLKVFQNKYKLRSPVNLDVLRTVSILMIGFLMLQVISPGAAFCLKEGSRVIQCRSIWGSSLPPVAAEIVETAEPGCCNKTCKEKPAADSQHHSSSGKTDKGSCCISLDGEHDGVICLSFSDLHILKPVIFFDPIEPFAVSNGLLLNSAAEKPPSLAGLRSVVLIL
jgi:hypothetical protein